MNRAHEPPPFVPKARADESIDDTLAYALYQLRLLVQSLGKAIQSGSTDREIVMGLKDAIILLMDLRKHEKELLEGVSDEDLARLASE